MNFKLLFLKVLKKTHIHTYMRRFRGTFFPCFFCKTDVPFLTFPFERGTFFNVVFTQPFSRTQEFSMKDKSLLGFIVIDILLAVGVVWGLMMGYKLLGYGLLVYFIINTLALVLKLTGNKKDGDGGDQK